MMFGVMSYRPNLQPLSPSADKKSEPWLRSIKQQVNTQVLLSHPFLNTRLKSLNPSAVWSNWMLTWIKNQTNEI